MPSRLIVLPRSRLQASLVALRMSSVRLVVLPLASEAHRAMITGAGVLLVACGYCCLVMVHTTREDTPSLSSYSQAGK